MYSVTSQLGPVVRIEQPDDLARLDRPGDPGQGQVGGEAVAVDLGTRLRHGRPSTGGHPTQLLGVGVERRRTRSWPGRRWGTLPPPAIRASTGWRLAAARVEPVDQVVVRPVGHVAGERQRQVPLLRVGPPERHLAPARGDERLEVVEHVVGRDHRHEHPGHPSSVTPAALRWLRSERQRASRNHPIKWFRDGRRGALLNHRRRARGTGHRRRRLSRPGRKCAEERSGECTLCPVGVTTSDREPKVGRGSPGTPHRRGDGHRPRSRPISSFMISLEPAQILETRASRQARATRYSFM